MIATGTPLISLHHVGLEHLVAEIGGLDVLRDEIDPALEIVVHDFLHALGAVGELPVGGHDVHAQQFAGVHHVLRRWSTATWPSPARYRRRRAAARRDVASRSRFTSVARCAKPPTLP